ncbi:RNA polymerase factor sigma-54, partial [Planctomycetota bacterium]
WLGRRAPGGFQPYSLEELVESMEEPCSTEEAERILRVIQTLEPRGVGARDLTECLLIQIGDGFVLERRLVERHLDDLKMNRLPKVAKETGRTIEEIKDAVAFIATLKPHPGATYSGTQANHVIPDVLCDLVDGDYDVQLNDAYLPRIHVSSRYRRMLEEERSNRAVRDYIKKKIESAKWLVDSIEQRQNTLRRISNEIVEYQTSFLDKGIDALRPLKMQEIADRVGVHVSTVSRAISEKWMQTPRGIFPLKFFFNGGTINADGDAESILAIKQKVHDIVDQEDQRKPLSDEDIARKLRHMGYDIARRTVTKYRKQIGILSSRQRREY